MPTPQTSWTTWVARVSIVVALAAATSVARTLPAGAASVVIQVTSTADTHDPGTLRSAIDAANSSTADAVTIAVPVGTYKLVTCTVRADDTNVGGDLDLHTANPATAVTIVGTGGHAVLQQGCGGERVIDQLGAGRLTLTDVTIKNGNGWTVGGGVRAAGPVTVTDGSFVNNRARGTTGANQVPDDFSCHQHLVPSHGGPATGGAISAAGPVDLVDTTFSGNQAVGGGGGWVNTWCGDGQGGAASGGAIDATGDVTITRGSFTADVAVGGRGGPVYIYQYSQPGGNARGGAVSTTGAIAIDGTTFDASAATGGQGGGAGSAAGGTLHALGRVALTSVAIAGSKATGGDGGGSPCAVADGGSAEGGAVWTGATLDGSHSEIVDSVARGGKGSGEPTLGGCADRPVGAGGPASGGGALAHGDATLVASTVRGNQAIGGASGANQAVPCCAIDAGGDATGGGVRSAAAIHAEASTVQANLAAGGLGGPGGTAHGGGLAAATGTDLRGSSVTANEARAGRGFVGAPIDAAAGTAAGGGVWDAGVVTVSASTFAANVAGAGPADAHNAGSGIGGGLRSEQRATLTNATLAQNVVDGTAGGAAASAPDLELVHVTVDANQGPSALTATDLGPARSVLAGQVGGALCSATSVTSHGYNQAADGSCGLDAIGDVPNASSPLLGPLGGDGVPPATEVPQAGSPLIDAVPLSACPTPFDEHGLGRPGGSACDIGAVEVDGQTPPAFTDVPETAPLHDDISWLVLHHIATGDPGNAFRPAAPLSRQAMAAFLYRIAGAPDGPHPTCSGAPLPDVAPTNPFCGEIAWLVSHHLATGYDDGTFRPTATVSRQAAAAYLYRLDAVRAGRDVPALPSCDATPFPDVPTSDPFCGAIAWMVTRGITSGYPDGTFRPSAPVTRQAIAAFLHRTSNPPPA